MRVPMKCHVVFLSGTRTGEAANFEADRITIGRAQNCHLRFDPFADLSVASVHAEILFDEGAFTIHDMSSRGGTYVNGLRIAAHQTLRSEDFLQFGKQGPEVVFRIGHLPPGPPQLPPQPPPTAELEFLTGADAGKVFYVSSARPNRVGRKPDVEIALNPRGDMMVSGSHCILRFEAGQFTLTDTSRNGTFINGRVVSKLALLQDGDVLTFGDGGPRARFRVVQSRRFYPNRPDAVEGEGESSVSVPVAYAAPPRPVAPTAPPPDVARAALREDEPTPPSMPAVPAPDESPSEAQRLLSETSDVFRGILESGGQETEPPPPLTMPPTARPKSAPFRPGSPQRRPGGTSTSSQAAAPAPRRAGRKVSLPLIGAGVLGLAVLIGLVVVLVRLFGGETATDEVKAYVQSIAQPKRRENTEGQFAIGVPSQWSARDLGNSTHLESPDKQVFVDFMRDVRLSEDSVMTLLERQGGKPKKLADTEQRDGAKESSFGATVGTRGLFAVLRQPSSGAPALALMDAPNDVLQALPEKSLRALLRDGFELTGAGGTQTAAATPPPARTPAPTPSATPAPAPTPESTPAPRTPAIASGRGGTVVNEQARLTLDLGENWQYLSNEAEGVISLLSPRGIDIRVTREPGRVTPQSVYNALRADGWDVVKTEDPSTPEGFDVVYTAGELRKSGIQLVLVMIIMPDDTTTYVHATKEGRMNDADREDTVTVVLQLLSEARI